MIDTKYPPRLWVPINSANNLPIDSFIDRLTNENKPYPLPCDKEYMSVEEHNALVELVHTEIKVLVKMLEDL